MLRHPPPGDAGADDLSGACLKLFPLAPGDLVVGSNGTSEAPEMDADRGDDDDDPTATGLRLWPCTRATSMAAFKAMVQAVRAP